MTIKEHQKKAILKDIPAILTLIVFILLVFAFYMVRTAVSAKTAGLSFILFFILLSFYLCCSNPGLVKVLRARLLEKRHYLWSIPVALSGFLILYSSAINSFSMPFSMAVLCFCFIPVLLLMPLLERGPEPHPLDVILILFLSVPCVYLSRYSIGLPPVQKFIDLSYLTAINLLVFIYAVVRQVPFTLRLRFAELRVALYGYMILMVVSLLLIQVFGTMDMTHYSSAGLLLVVRTIVLAFFVAVPEEFFYRGVILEFLCRLLPSQKRHHYFALVISALIFAAAHLPACHFFGSLVYSGYPFRDQSPVLQFTLMMLAGLFYGHVFLKTNKVGASAVTHFLFLWSFITLFGG